eukprot:TRINITY_DN20707_c0_g1_i2.p3 TRINITY_DN20707_c0_g1~~TRINITY_DN20707_c0_g1_i2.p3  ORF type:complete len:101 (+),score=1.73 TRINITY_DN20707_c0_g1_i2:141-443(+)
MPLTEFVQAKLVLFYKYFIATFFMQNSSALNTLCLHPINALPIKLFSATLIQPMQVWRGRGMQNPLWHQYYMMTSEDWEHFKKKQYLIFPQHYDVGWCAL